MGFHYEMKLIRLSTVFVIVEHFHFQVFSIERNSQRHIRRSWTRGHQIVVNLFGQLKHYDVEFKLEITPFLAVD